MLITGAMGHVGLEVVRQAQARGLPIVAGYRGTFKPEVAAGFGPDVHWQPLDLASESDIARLADLDIEGVIHTAAAPNEAVCRPDPLGAMKSNVFAPALLLDLARRGGWRRFINVSTGSVFQNVTDYTAPILEDHPISFENVYSTTKACSEMLTGMYRSQYGLSAATVRISWVYGPPLIPKVRENPRGPIPWFLRQVMTGQSVREASGGDFAASFTHVADVAAGLLAAYSAGGLNHGVYHLGSGRNHSTFEVIDAIRRCVPEADIAVGPGTAPWTDHTRMRAPLAGTRLADDTGFRPRFGLAEGIAEFVTWLRAHPESLT